MFATSASKVRLPSAADFIVMRLDKSFGDTDLPGCRTGVLRRFNYRLQPELRLAALTIHMNVHSCFLAGKEIEAEPSELPPISRTPS